MNYKQASDMELLQCCQNDDIRAYNELVDRYAPRLHKIGIRYLRDEFVVEELAMDLLYNIWERRCEISIHFSFSAYLFKAFRNMIVRQLTKNIPISTSIEELAESQLPVAGNSADDDLIREQTDMAYRKSLALLSTQRRMVFELSREENLSYRAIAERTGLSVNTVENYMAAALAILRKNFNKFTLHIGTASLFALHF